MSDQLLHHAERLPLFDDRTEPEISIWNTSTTMAGSEFERKTYYMTLKDGDKVTKFSLQTHADGTIVAVPYVDADYDYGYYDDEGYCHECDSYYCGRYDE